MDKDFPCMVVVVMGLCWFGNGYQDFSPPLTVFCSFGFIEQKKLDNTH
jgi:hypothetical protein